MSDMIQDTHGTFTTLRLNLQTHIKGEYFARHLNDTHNEERHAESRKNVERELLENYGQQILEVLSVLKEETLIEALRELPALDAQMQEAARLFGGLSDHQQGESK